MAAKSITIKVISKFYLSIILLIISLVLGYGSYFLIIYMVVIGFSLIFLQFKFEEKIFREFENSIYNKQKINKIEAKDYETLWRKYVDKKLKKKKRNE